MSLKVRELEVFRAIMATGSITQAAQLLHVTQPAISKTLQQTEDRMGFRFFVRDHGRLTPTPEARALLPEVMKAVSAIESVQRLAEDLKSVRTGLITLAAAPALATSILPPVIRHFRDGRPDVSVSLQSLTNLEVARLVAEHRVDLGFVLAPTEDAGALARDLCTTGLVCVVPRGHALEAGATVGARELGRFPLISFSLDRPIGTLIDRAFEQAGMRRVIAVEVTQSAAALALVRSGAGIAIMDGFALMGQTEPGLIMRPFRPALRTTCRLLWSRHHPQSRLAATFVGALDNEISRLTTEATLAQPLEAAMPRSAVSSTNAV
jgi:DNA-binding transcriptional LysR family regulator